MNDRITLVTHQLDSSWLVLLSTYKRGTALSYIINEYKLIRATLNVMLPVLYSTLCILLSPI
jgi:hypothetical protein